jgi:hypothetical protein
MPENYEGEERRNDYCPVHHIKCKEMEKLETGLAGKVPIWVFKIAVTIIILALGSMNAYFYKMSSSTLVQLERHVDISNTIMKQMSRKNREVILNQKIVMEHLKIPYREIPNYYGDEKN